MDALIGIEGQVFGELPFAADRETLPKLAERIGALFEPAVATEGGGLYLASSNAGFQSAVSFWSDARRSGFAVASPESFPWTLANASCAWLAREFHVTGPSYTYTGRSVALAAAWTQAQDDLVAGRVPRAWIVALDFALAAAESTSFAAVRLACRPSQRSGAPASSPELAPSTLSSAALLERIRGFAGSS
jgi:3-oxoacyl-(acyl-carrier-protein) synthase